MCFYSLNINQIFINLNDVSSKYFECFAICHSIYWNHYFLLTTHICHLLRQHKPPWGGFTVFLCIVATLIIPCLSMDLVFFHHVVLCRQLDSVIQCSLVFACRLEFHSSLVFVFLRDVFIPLPRLFPPFVTQYNVKVFLSAFLLCWHLLYSTYSYALSNIFPFVRLSATLLQPSIPIIVHRPFLIFWTVNHFCQMAEGQI